MEVDSSPAVQAQRAAHPELGEQLDQLEQYKAAKLYHQLTQGLLTYLASPPLVVASPAIAAELRSFFDDFIKPFNDKFDPVKWVQILQAVCRPQTQEAGLELIQPYEEKMEKNKAAKQLWQILKAELLTLSGKLDEAKDLLDGVGKEIFDAYEVQALVQSQFHKINAMLWKTLSRPHEFYKSSILFLSFTALATIPKEERAKLAFEIGVAALVAEEEFDIGELMKQEICGELDGSSYAWVKELLIAFSEGRFDLYDAALAKHRIQIDASPELKGAESSVLRSKMEALALMELAFRQPKKQRRLQFDAIAQHCRVDAKGVEFLIMKAMCANLIRGQISEVEQHVAVTWVKPRTLDIGRISIMKTRVDEWSATTGALLDHLEEMTPELLVSC